MVNMKTSMVHTNLKYLEVFQKDKRCGSVTIFIIKLHMNPGGGALTLESGKGMCCSHDLHLLFQASGCSLAYQFTLNAPLICPPFSIL